MHFNNNHKKNPEPETIELEWKRNENQKNTTKTHLRSSPPIAAVLQPTRQTEPPLSSIIIKTEQQYHTLLIATTNNHHRFRPPSSTFDHRPQTTTLITTVSQPSHNRLQRNTTTSESPPTTITHRRSPSSRRPQPQPSKTVVHQPSSTTDLPFSLTGTNFSPSLSESHCFSLWILASSFSLFASLSRRTTSFSLFASLSHWTTSFLSLRASISLLSLWNFSLSLNSPRQEKGVEEIRLKFFGLLGYISWIRKTGLGVGIGSGSWHFSLDPWFISVGLPRDYGP